MINVAIVEDVKIIREGLKTLLESSANLNCTGIYESFEDFIEGIDESKPEVILIDIELPGISGVEGIKKLKTLSDNYTIIVLTVYEENDRIFEAIEAGASSYLVKNTMPSKIIKVIEDAANGYVMMNSYIARKISALFDGYKLTNSLCQLDKNILDILVEGSNLPAMGARLNLSANDIKKRFFEIYKTVHNVSQYVGK